MFRIKSLLFILYGLRVTQKEMGMEIGSSQSLRANGRIYQIPNMEPLSSTM
jgi:hypothetical protein